MARTKQTARKWTGGKEPRRDLPSKKKVVKKVRFQSPVGKPRPSPREPPAKLREKMQSLPVWARVWAGRAHATISGVWVQASNEQAWTLAYRMAKLHDEGEAGLWTNLKIVMARMARLDISSITTASALMRLVKEPLPNSLAGIVAAHQRHFADASEPCVAWGSLGYAAALKHAIRKFGYCKVTGVIPEGRAAALRAEMLAWQSSLPAGTKVPPHGVYKHHYAGHQDFAWRIRGEHGVRQSFAAFWDVEDWRHGMITSQDGCCIVPSTFTRRDRAWPHVDQAPKSHGLRCIQGVVSLTSNERRTLVVHKYTHAAHSAYFAARGDGASAKKYVPVNQADVDPIAHLRTRVAVGAGDMVMWDSRLFHENEVGGAPGEARCAQYVCFLPRSHPGNTDAQQRKRMQCAQQRRTTSHWPVGIAVNGMQPQVYGDKSKLIDYGGEVQKPVFSSRTLDIITEIV